MGALIVVTSAKGAPGATTTAVGIAAAWPIPEDAPASGTPVAGEPLVVEADPAGGDLAAAFGLSPRRGLVGVAAAARPGVGAEAVWREAEHLPGSSFPGDTLALVAPAKAAPAAAAVDRLAAVGFAPLRGAAGRGATVVVDIGRLYREHPAAGLVSVADLVLVVGRGTVSGLGHLADGVSVVREMTPRVAAVLVGSPLYSSREVSVSIGVRVAAVLPVIERAAGQLMSPDGIRRGNRLARAFHTLADDLADGAHGTPAPDTRGSSTGFAPQGGGLR